MDAVDDGVGLEDLEPPILDPNWDRDQETLQNTGRHQGVGSGFWSNSDPGLYAAN